MAFDPAHAVARHGRKALAAWTAAVFVFLYAPIVLLMVYSFNASRLNILWTGATLRWYRELWHDAPILAALQNSLIVAIAATAASVFLGTSGAWLMHRRRYRCARGIRTLLAVPMVMPEIIMGVGLLVFFTMLRVPLGFTTVILAHTTFCFPFVLVTIQARLEGMDPSLEEAALDLGASPWTAFRLVIVPSLRPAILAGALLAFTLSMDELIVTYFTSSAASATLPLKVFGLAKIGLNPMLNALSTLFVVATAAAVPVLSGARRLAVRRRLSA